MPLEQITADRVDIEGEVTPADIEWLQSTPRGVTIQFSKPIKPASFDLLEAEFFAHRADATLRVYGHYQERADLSFLSAMPSVTRFWANGLTSAKGLGHVAELPRLRELWIGIDDLVAFDFLDHVPTSLEILGLGDTQSKRPSVAELPRFQQLKHLMLVGHPKGLDATGELACLEELALWSYSNPDLAFLERLQALRKLEINLGGGLDYSAVGATPALHELHLTWIRRLADISFISQMSTLRYLMLDRMAQVRQLPDMRGLTHLKSLTITQLKNLESAAPVAEAPALEDFRYGPSPAVPTVGDLEVALRAPALKKFTAWIRGRQRKRLLEQEAARRGLEVDLG